MALTLGAKQQVPTTSPTWEKRGRPPGKRKLPRTQTQEALCLQFIFICWKPINLSSLATLAMERDCTNPWSGPARALRNCYELVTNLSGVLWNILKVNGFPAVMQDEGLSNLIWLLNDSWRMVWWEAEITEWLGKSHRTMKAGNKI